MEQRKLLVVWSIFCSVCSSGCVFGWPAMKEILEVDGVFASHDATERKARFAQVIMSGSAIRSILLAIPLLCTARLDK
jgi:hypothetical protein